MGAPPFLCLLPDTGINSIDQLELVEVTRIIEIILILLIISLKSLESLMVKELEDGGGFKGVVLYPDPLLLCVCGCLFLFSPALCLSKNVEMQNGFLQTQRGIANLDLSGPSDLIASPTVGGWN